MSGIISKRTVFYNSKVPQTNALGCVLFPVTTKAKTNYHYKCARKLVQGNRGGVPLIRNRTKPNFYNHCQHPVRGT